MEKMCDDLASATPEELALLAAVKSLFASKGDYAGAAFRMAFVYEAMDGYCANCGNGGPDICYCTRDD